MAITVDTFTHDSAKDKLTGTEASDAGILAKDMWKTGSSISGSSYTLEAKKWKELLAERDNKYATFSSGGYINAPIFLPSFTLI